MKGKIMKRVLLCAALAMTVPAYNVQAAEQLENLMPGGDFEMENGQWGLYTESGGSASYGIEDGKMVLHIEKCGSVDHGVQLYCDGFKLVKKAKYRISFDISSSQPRTFEWRAQINGGDYHAYFGEQQVAVGPEGLHYEQEFVMEEDTDPAPRFCFNLGDKNKAQGLEAHDVRIDNVCLEMIEAGEEEDGGDETGPRFFFNQVGYRTGGDKLVKAVRVEPGTAYEVIYKDTGKVMASGQFGDAVESESVSAPVVTADISEVKMGGTYLLRLEDGTESPAFVIGGDYKTLLADTVRMLSLQRCGTALSEEMAGSFAHDVCHAEPAVLYGGGETLEVSGGWHDAGDYGRYTVPGAKAAADLLLAYEMNPAVFDDELGIPESGNGVPDLLDEARYELEWLLKMQSSEGGVYHKVTGLNFDPTVRADECTETLYVLPVSQAATGDFAAVMYMAARTYGEVDPAFADTCLEAADRALGYFEAHQGEPGFTNPSDVLTGEYPDTQMEDEYYWALAEGVKTTADAELAAKLSTLDLAGLGSGNFGWQDVAGYGAYALLSAPEDAMPAQARETVKEGWLRKVQELEQTIGSDPYGSSIERDYPWGSNMTIANNGMMLALTEKLAEAALQLDYLLGVNATGYCFVSGYGTKAPEHPHHRPSQSVGETMKGMLAGGPNSSLEDPYAANVLAGNAPAECYADSDQSYSTNEVAIYWNSPLAALLAGVLR